jgi:hypothetical protein
MEATAGGRWSGLYYTFLVEGWIGEGRGGEMAGVLLMEVGRSICLFDRLGFWSSLFASSVQCLQIPPLMIVFRSILLFVVASVCGVSNTIHGETQRGVSK